MYAQITKDCFTEPTNQQITEVIQISKYISLLKSSIS